MRLEYAGSGISASAICPGFTDDGGIYELLQQEMGRRVPWIIGGTTAEKVAKKVLKALRTDPPMIIVDRPGVRAFFALAFVFPRFEEWFTQGCHAVLP